MVDKELATSGKACVHASPQDEALPGFSERVKDLIKGESERNFARRAGIPPSTLKAIRNGSKPTVGNLVAIARAGEVTVDWLATGEGPMRAAPVTRAPLDEALLAESLRLVEEWLQANRRAMAPERKAQVVSEIYAMALDDIAEGKPMNTRNVGRILRLVG